MTRILITGARDWTDGDRLYEALSDLEYEYPGAVLVHGDALGVDREAAKQWELWGLPTEAHPASDHATPLDRNLHMVGLGADLCIAFATRWASGTGHCARAARRAGIPTIDYGVSTAPEDR